MEIGTPGRIFGGAISIGPQLDAIVLLRSLGAPVELGNSDAWSPVAARAHRSSSHVGKCGRPTTCKVLTSLHQVDVLDSNPVAYQHFAGSRHPHRLRNVDPLSQHQVFSLLLLM